MSPACSELPVPAQTSSSRQTGFLEAKPPLLRFLALCLGDISPDKRDLLSAAAAGSGRRKIKGEISKFRQFSWQTVTAQRGEDLSDVYLEIQQGQLAADEPGSQTQAQAAEPQHSPCVPWDRHTDTRTAAPAFQKQTGKSRLLCLPCPWESQLPWLGRTGGPLVPPAGRGKGVLP